MNQCWRKGPWNLIEYLQSIADSELTEKQFKLNHFKNSPLIISEQNWFRICSECCVHVCYSVFLSIISICSLGKKIEKQKEKQELWVCHLFQKLYLIIMDWYVRKRSLLSYLEFFYGIMQRIENEWMNEWHFYYLTHNEWKLTMN